ncbi:MAG: hypothetical protein ACR2JD_02930 [Nocardioides sp.]
MDLEAAVVEAWRRTAATMPGVRAILDRYVDAPLDGAMATALGTATDREHAVLAVSAGQCGTDDAAGPRLGAALEDRARRAGIYPAPSLGRWWAAGRLATMEG